MPAVLFPYELTMEVPTEHLLWMYNFLSKLKCRWKFPPAFSLTAKMSLEISTASFLSAKTSLEISPTFFSHSWNVAGNFHRHFFSVTAKMSLEISTDIFSLSQSAAENFHRHFFLSQLKCRCEFHQQFSPTASCRWKFPPTFSFTSRKYQWKIFCD